MAALTPAPDDRVLAAVAADAETIVTALVATFEQDFPDPDARFGAGARAVCAQDARYHIEHLLAALATADTAPFEAYCAWLAVVLESRGIDPSHLRASLVRLRVLVTARLGAAADKAAVRTVVDAGIAALAADRATALMPDGRAPVPLSGPDAFVDLLLHGRREAARRTVTETLAGDGDLVAMEVGLIQPSLYRIGRLWAENRIGVAQEHLATGLTQQLMAQAYARASLAPSNRRRALLACVEGNRHGIGLRMVADAFELRGWEVQYLGPDTPTDALVRQVEAWRPELIGLSVSVLQQFPALKQVIERLRRALGAGCPPIMVGGLATNLTDDLWRASGADLWAPDAVDAAGRTE